MHRTTINLPEPILQQAKLKALREGVTISEVLRGLLARWVAGDIQLAPHDAERQRLAALARTARGMWADRNPDEYLATSRAGLMERDRELQHARLVVR
jgi:hypothetical protein